MKRLENKIAVVYGKGAIGSAIASVFEKEGANVFSVGRIELDALDEQAVEDHMDELIGKTGRIDISFNAIY